MTTSHSRIRRRAGRDVAATAVVGVAFVGVAFVAALWGATPALAHNYYIDSTPEINEVVTTLPDQFVVTTNDNLLNLDGGHSGFMKVTGPDGLYYGDGCVTVDGPSVSMPAALGPAGDYTIEWQAVSTDGHTISDTIPFTWQPSAGEESTTQGSSTVPNCGEESVSAPEPGDVTAQDEVTSDILWIGAAVLAVAVTIAATLILLRPSKKGDA